MVSGADAAAALVNGNRTDGDTTEAEQSGTEGASRRSRRRRTTKPE